MAMDAASRVPLDYPGTIEDLARHRIALRDGMSLVLYTDDATEIDTDDPLLGIGIVEFDRDASRWYAKFDVNALEHLSDVDADRRSKFGSSRDIRER